MSNARNLARLVVDSSGDVAAASLDNVPPSNDASALTTGTLPVGRLPSSGVDASSLTAGTLGAARLPAGSVLQLNTLVDATKKTMSGYTNYTGYSIALSSTLVSTSSKILILTSTFMGHNNNVTVALNWSSSSSSLSRVSAASGSANDMVDTEAYLAGTDRSGVNLSFLKLITPSTTTPQTYYLWSTTATGDTAYLNSSSNGNTTQSLGSSQYWVGQGTTHIVIMEIGA